MADHLKRELDMAAAALAAASCENVQQVGDMPALIAKTLVHTERMQDAMDTVGADVDSMRCLVLPMLEENAAKLEELYAALDVVGERVLPEVKASLARMETSVRALEERQAELQPSSLRRMGTLLSSYSSFFSKASASSSSSSASASSSSASSSSKDTVAAKAFVPPRVFSTGALLANGSSSPHGDAGGAEDGIAGDGDGSSSSSSGSSGGGGIDDAAYPLGEGPETPTLTDDHADGSSKTAGFDVAMPGGATASDQQRRLHELPDEMEI